MKLRKLWRRLLALVDQRPIRRRVRRRLRGG